MSRPFNNCINSSYLQCLNKAWTTRIIWLHTNERSWRSRLDNINNETNETCSGKELKTPSSFRITFISYSTWLQTAIKKKKNTSSKMRLCNWRLMNSTCRECLWEPQTKWKQVASGYVPQIKKKRNLACFFVCLFSTIKAIIF